MWENGTPFQHVPEISKNFPWVTKQNHILHMAIKDKMLMITPTTLTLVKERTYRELFKSIDEKMLTIKCLGIKEKKETMTHVKKKRYLWKTSRGHITKACMHAPKAFTARGQAT